MRAGTRDVPSHTPGRASHVEPGVNGVGVGVRGRERGEREEREREAERERERGGGAPAQTPWTCWGV